MPDTDLTPAPAPDAAPARTARLARPASRRRSSHRIAIDRLRTVAARCADDEGASTAEYAIVVMASVALAAVLVMVAQSDAVKSAIENLMIDAFSY